MIKQKFEFRVGILLLLNLLLLSSCETSEPTPYPGFTEKDTLITMVEEEIEQKKQQQKKVKDFQRKQLPKHFYQKLKQYHPIIRKYSHRYRIDWRLIVAQILKESRFIENARSNVGAMGLMQIMPGTARQITRELDIEYIAKDPRENIAAGVYHMYKQLKYFPKANPENAAKLALAAYNCGAGRVFNARDIARYKRLDPNSWEAVRSCLPLLTSNDWKLHLEVWEQGRPSYGYFYGFGETINYVDHIYEKYSLMQHFMN